MLEELKITD